MFRIRNLFLAAAVLCGTAACGNKQEPREPATPAALALSFEAAAPATRTAFVEPEGDTYPAVWQAGDKVKLFLNGGEVNPTGDRGVMEATITDDGKAATFRTTLPDPGALESFNYGVLSPASAFSALDATARELSLVIPDSQQGTALSPDPAAMLLWAAAGPYGNIKDPVKLSFAHLTAYGRLTLTGLRGTLRAVELVSDRDLAGVWRFPSQTAPGSSWTDVLTPKNPVRRIQIAATDPEAVWFACAPGDWSGSSLQVTATTSEGAFARTVSFPSGRTLRPGQIARFGVDMSEASTRTDVFDETQIVFSFGAISDTHIQGTSDAPAAKLKSALNQLKTCAAAHDADGLDAVLVAGDLTQTGSSVYAQTGYFKTLYEQVLNPREVPMVYTIGNHDANPSYWWTSNTITQAAVMAQVLGDDYFLTDQDLSMRAGYECRDNLIAGYHILSLTPTGTNPVTYPSESKAWLDARLSALTEADPERFVLVNTHPMIDNTCYGSLLGTPTGKAQSDIWDANDSWATRDLTDILAKYPQVVTFGGHLHFPLNDPRSFYQGNFTSMGCASTRYMAIENGKYEDMESATVMNDKDQFSQGWLIQLDRSGNLRATPMDFYHSAVIGTPYEIPYPRTDRSHLTRYDASRTIRNHAPVLDPERLVVTSRETTSGPETLVQWARGEDDEFVHHYVLQVSRDGAPVLKKKYLADFYRHPLPSEMKESWSASLGLLMGGSYQLTLTAYDSWDASTSCTKTFTVEGPEPPEPGLYADLDFADGAVTDARDRLLIDNRDATFAATAVSHAGKSATVPALLAGSGKAVRCQFKDMRSSADVAAFFGTGFAVEAMFVDRTRNNAIHGVVCGTQDGGWGLAMRANGTPYFIVGEGSRANYVSVDATAAASTTELTHVVCVYDPSAKKMFLYVNGVLNATKAVSGNFYSGVGDTFNRFCLGADIAPGDASTDFPSADMVIVDAKFYVGPLDAAAVQAAYNNAVNALNP